MYEYLEVNCFELGCLHCDRPTSSGESYCSQTCRLAQVDCAANVNQTTITTPSYTHTSAMSSFSESPKSFTGFYLPPAIDFQSYRRSSVQYQQQQPSSTKSPKLSPASSRSSLKSEISIQAQHELLHYTNAFDTSRELKRRMTQ